MHTHTQETQTTQKDHERTQKEQAKEISKLYRKTKAHASLSQKKKKSVCENITQKNVYSYREIERGRRRLRQAAKKSLQVL
jgi:hypothetical protein